MAYLLFFKKATVSFALVLAFSVVGPSFAMAQDIVTDKVYCDESACDAVDDAIWLDPVGSSCDAGGCDGVCQPTCSGPICHCYLDAKKSLADCGIGFVGNLTQFYFGTVDGGVEQRGRYGGHGDYVANIDAGKVGIHKGLFIKLRAEHRFGNSISEDAGVIFPPTLATDLPVSDSRDLYLTNVLFTQFLSDSFAVYAGKLDSLDGDLNSYASGRGISQFSNTAMIANPIALRTIPYASLGCGFAIIRDGEPLFNFLVINPTDTADSDGFDELFREGVALSAELRFPTHSFGKPGHQLFGATWSSRDFVELGQDPRVVLPNVPINRSSGSWSLYWNTDQALWVDPCAPERHWGYFARAGIADDSTNPLGYFLSLGLGGRQPNPNRGYLRRRLFLLGNKR